jgi:hypothetical protein
MDKVRGSRKLISKQIVFIVIVIVLHAFSVRISAQTEPELVENTFRTFNLVNGQSSETLWKNNLFFAISHRFTAPVTSGTKEFWGMDSYANIRLGLAYGITDNLTLGIGRSRLDKIYDAYAKYRVLRQAYDGMPITLSVFGQAGIMSKDFPDNQADEIHLDDRLSYALQIMLSRKINEWLSLQVTPSLTHQNLATRPDQPNTRFSFGTAIHGKITGGTSFIAEYYINSFTEDPNSQDVVGLSVDFTSVRHSFQIQLTNATSLIPAEIMANTNRSFFSSEGLFLGFHITRKFGL